MKTTGHTELFVDDPNAGKHVLREPYSGKLVVTAHATELSYDPNWADSLTRELERFMRSNKLSRLKAYWNAIPPEDTSDDGSSS